MNMPNTTIERRERARARSSHSRATLALVPARKVELNKGDLLAVPVCILWGICLWLSMYGPWAVFGLDSNSSAAGWLTSLWHLPATLVRFLFGG
jgi:hypothetical protein